MLLHEKIMELVKEMNDSDKSVFVEDLLIMLGEDEQIDILFKLQNGIPLLSGD